MKYLLILALFCNSAFAYEVKYLETGQLVPFTGFLISPALEKEFRLMDKELDYYKKLTVSLETINKSYQENSVIMEARIDNQQKYIEKINHNDSFLNKYGMFILGVLTATASAFAVKQVTK